MYAKEITGLPSVPQNTYKYPIKTSFHPSLNLSTKIAFPFGYVTLRLRNIPLTLLYRRRGGETPSILSLSTRYSWAISLLIADTYWTECWVVFKAGLYRQAIPAPSRRGDRVIFLSVVGIWESNSDVQPVANHWMIHTVSLDIRHATNKMSLSKTRKYCGYSLDSYFFF